MKQENILGKAAFSATGNKLSRRSFVLGTAGMMGMAVFGASGCNAESSEPTGVTSDDGSAPSSTDTENNASSYPLTLKNYRCDGANFEEEDIIFEQAPQQVFAANQGSAETMCMLGLEAVIVGTANKTSEPVPEIADAYNALNLVTEDYAGPELMLATDPDLVIGRGAIFSDTEYGVGTTESLKEMEIKSWVLSSSAPESKLDNLYKDIREIGQIFDVQEKANSWADELDSRMHAIQEKLTDIEDERSYLFLVNARSGNGYMVFSGGQCSQQEDAFKMLGLKNATTEVNMDAVNAENILAYAPDIILPINYTPGDTTATEAMIDDLRNNPSLETLPAVINNEFYIVEYNDIFSFSFRMVDGVEKLAEELYPDEMKS